MRIESPTGAVLSGHAYLSAVMRKPDTPADMKLTKLPIAAPKNCDHTAKVCTTCVHEWNWDYKIYLKRTAAGRKMLAELPEGWEKRGPLD